MKPRRTDGQHGGPRASYFKSAHMLLYFAYSWFLLTSQPCFQTTQRFLTDLWWCL